MSTTRGLAPIPGQSAEEGQSLAMIVALTSEVTVLRSRLDTLERLLADAKLLPTDAIETFAPDATAQAARDTLRQRILQRVFRPLREQAALDAAS